jgi:hypothetical protein
MKSSAILCRVPACLFLLSASLGAQQLDDSMTLLPWTGGTLKSEFSGIAGRTYFYQSSMDLVTWKYVPFMAFGSGTHEYTFTPAQPKMFLRLHRHDDPAVTNLQEAMDADPDGDLATSFWDILLNQSPLVSNLLDNTDLDSMTFSEEFLSGRNPALADPVLDPTSRSLDVFSLSPF